MSVLRLILTILGGMVLFWAILEGTAYIMYSNGYNPFM